MPNAITNVALVGASGTLGSHILQALVDTGRVKVTILARKSMSDLPAETSLKIVDFESAASLRAAMLGQDALIDATSIPDPVFSIRLVDSAVAAGVYRVIPSEFSSDPTNTKARNLPPFWGKAQVLAYLQKLADKNKITWTTISNHAFLDWGLRTSFLGIDLQNKKIEYLMPGNTVIPMTTLKSVATAVANALYNAEATKNRICYICNTQKTQKELVELAKQAFEEKEWRSEDVDTKKAFEGALSQLNAGHVDMKVMGDMIRFSISTEGYIEGLEKTDNDVLGVRAMSDDDIKELIRDIAREGANA